MKTIAQSLLVALTLAGLSSCAGGGWSASQEAEFLKACEGSGSFDCKCALEATKKKYPNNSDFVASGGTDTELSLELIKSCSK